MSELKSGDTVVMDNMVEENQGKINYLRNSNVAPRSTSQWAPTTLQAERIVSVGTPYMRGDQEMYPPDFTPMEEHKQDEKTIGVTLPCSSLPHKQTYENGVNELFYHHLRGQTRQLKALNLQCAALQEMMVDVHSEMEVLRERLIKPPRDVITCEEFSILLNSIRGNSYASARKKCAHILLFASGVTLEDLRLFTVAQAKELLEGGEVTIFAIQGGARDLTISPSTLIRKKMDQFNLEFQILMRGKSEGDPLFTTSLQLDRPINRSSFNYEMNKDLKLLGEKVGKNLKTHSYRLGRIIHVYKESGLQVAEQTCEQRSSISRAEEKPAAFDVNVVDKEEPLKAAQKVIHAELRK